MPAMRWRRGRRCAEHRPPGRAVDARGLIIGVGDRLQAGIAQQRDEIWQVFARTDIGLLGAFLNRLGLDYNYAGNALAACWMVRNTAHRVAPSMRAA
jgi:hypothetical protein